MKGRSFLTPAAIMVASCIAVALCAGAAVPQTAVSTHADVLRMADGSVVLGAFRSFDGTTVEFQTETARLRVPRKDVAAIILAGEVTAQVGSLTGPPTDHPEKEPAPDLGLTGTWRTDRLGELRVLQEGRRIYGTYGTKDARVDGYIHGDEIRFWWWEGVPQGKAWWDALPANKGFGFLRVVGRGELEGGWHMGHVPRKNVYKLKGHRIGPLPDGFRKEPPAAFVLPPNALKWW